MPNHVTNLITFGPDAEARSAFHRMLEDMRAKDGVLGSIDFNKLIPMPKSLDVESGSRGKKGLEIVREFLYAGVNVSLDTFRDKSHDHRVTRLCKHYREEVKRDPEILELGWTYYRNLRAYGSATWYEWCNQHWGTKWNAYDCVPLDKNADTMRFCTAWSDISELVGVLSTKYPDAKITYRWADEDMGRNVGERVFQNGEIVDWDIPEGGSREAFEMAAEIRGVDLAEYNLSLSKDGTTYEYREEAEPIIPPPPKEKSAPAKKRKLRTAR